jgi:hypothetical protein
VIATFAVLVGGRSVLALSQVTVWTEPPSHVTGVFGEVTRNGPAFVASVTATSAKLLPPPEALRSRTDRRKCRAGAAGLQSEVGRNSEKHSLTGIGTGGAIGPPLQAPVSAFVLLLRICSRSGKTRVGLVVT